MSTITIAPPITSAARPPEPVADPRWARPAFLGLLLATAAFWSTALSHNGWANSFYAAAVQAGTKSWTAFLFGSSDAANTITVDKPPASLWPMEISGRIFGFNSWSMLLPQVMLGVASVALLYVIIKKQFGPGAALMAAAALALTPVATLMFRNNNPDALLVFLMIAAVWAVLRAVEDGRTRWLLLCGAVLGLGFLTKQLQVLLVTPGLALTYLVAGPPRLRVRLGQLLAGLAAMVVAAGWWVALVELTPADRRPYVGGSTGNSFLDLTFGYNGLNRLSGDDSHGPGAGVDVGLTRMFTGESGGQISWLLPAALILLVVGLVMCGRTARTDARRAQYLAWGGWLLGTGLVFSLMSGVFHDYYTVALAPAVAALVGIGAAELWRRRDSLWATVMLAGTAALTAAWAWVLLGRNANFLPWLRWVILTAGVLAAVGLVIAAVLPAQVSRLRDIRVWAAGLAVAAALAGPLAYSVQTVAAPRSGSIVVAGPSVDRGDVRGPDGPGRAGARGGFGGPPFGAGVPRGVDGVSSTLVVLLSRDADHFTWVAAATSSMQAAGYQLATGNPVIPIGGFGGGDPAPTLEQFQQYVADGRVHYYIASGRHGGPGDSSTSQAARISDWVTANFTATTVDGVTVYDLS